MAKVNAPLLAFNAGEVSKDALARVDIEKLRLAAEVQVNWLPSTVGAMSLRPGLGYIVGTKSDLDCLPVPFIFGASDFAMLLLTDSVMRVLKADALLTVTSVSTTVTNGDFSSGTGWTITASSGAAGTISGGILTLTANAAGSTVSCERSVSVSGGDLNVVHRLRIVVNDSGAVTFQIGSASGGFQYFGPTDLASGTHSIAFTPTSSPFYVRFSTATDGGKVVDSIQVEASGTLELPTAWTASDLDFVRYAQSGDIVYVACSGRPQYQIERRDNDSWSVVKYRADKGPFTAKPSWADSITMSLSTQIGQAVMTASRNYFNSDMVGQLFRLPNLGQSMARSVAGPSQFTEAIRVRGIGTTNDYGYTVAGTWSGSLQRMISYDGADTGFTQEAAHTGNASVGVTVATNHDNVTFWVKLGFRDSSDYTSGSADVTFQFSGSDGSAGVTRISGYTSATVVNVDLVKPVRSGVIGPGWEIGKWSADTVYPDAVGLYQGRLFWAQRDNVDGSVSDDYTNYDDTTAGESGPISRTIGGAEVSLINWLLPLDRLIIGCEGQEVALRSSSIEEPLTPTNANPAPISTQGSANLPALRVDNRGYFVEKSGRRVYEIAPTETGGYQSSDMTRINSLIGFPGFVALGAQRQPDTHLHFVRTDGENAILLREAGDQVSCWTRMMTLGVIERVAVLPGNLSDAVYFVVKRTINGSTKRFIEKLARRDQCVGGTLNMQADAYVSISQASSTTITGLSHLEGETVVVWANGKSLGSYAVASGQITGVSEAVTTAIVGLGGVTASSDTGIAVTAVSVGTKYNGYPAEVFANRSTGGRLRYVGTVTVASGVVTLPNGKSAMKVVVYLGYYGLFRSAKLAYGAQMGTALTERKKACKVGLVATNMHPDGIYVGQDVDHLDALPLVADGTTADTNEVWSEYDDDIRTVPGSWDTDARLTLLAQAPKPVTLSAVVVQVETHER